MASALPIKMTEERYHELCRDYCGICTACGEIAHGDTEPDAEGYFCGACEEYDVQGIENALIEGNIAIVDTESPT